MIINPYLVVPGTPPYDPDAQAFITATGLTTPTQQNAINELVLDLKSANIWTKFNALYPMITDKVTQVDIANQMKFNLKNPLDTDAAFRLSFLGGWTHSANGALPNGTNAYADTFLVGSTILTANNSHISFYSRTDSDTGGCDFGNTSNAFGPITRSGNTMYSDYLGNGSPFLASPDRLTVANPSSNAMFIFSSTATNIKTYKNNLLLGQKGSATASGYPSTSILFSFGYTSTALRYSNRQLAFASIGSGLTDTEAQLFYQIVEKYQVALSRNINPTQSFYYNRNYGAETNLYLFATQIADTTQQVALNTLVSDMKTYGIWSKMKAVYPMVTDKVTQVDIRSQMKFNLVNPQDTDSAFRLNFIGGLTFSSNGILGNGVNGLADTFLTPSSSLSLNNTHISIYSRTNSDGLYSDMGAQDTTSNNILAFTRNTNIINYRINEGFNSSSVTNTDSRGFFNSNRVASNSKRLFKNGVLLENNTTNTSTGLTTRRLGLFALYYENTPALSSSFTNREIAFASIGDGLTDTEASNFYTAVQNLQTTLGRAILPTPPIVSDPDAQAFINSANIVDQVEATAVNNLVIGLKADGLWTPMKAIYPMVGSSATSCAVNLKTVGTYNLSFVGGWTFSQNGALPNGTNAYADTSINSQSIVNTTNHLSFYSRTQTVDLSNACEIGVADTNNAQYNQLRLNVHYVSGGVGAIVNYSNTTDARGFWIGTKRASNDRETYLNGITQNTVTTNDTTNNPSYNIYISARNNPTTSPAIALYSAKQCAFASIGDGLTDVQATNLYTRVQAFNTALNRQV